MQSGMSFGAGKIYMKGADGNYQPMGDAVDFTDTISDEAPGVPIKINTNYTVDIQLPRNGQTIRRIRRALLNWRAKGPIRKKLLLRTFLRVNARKGW